MSTAPAFGRDVLSSLDERTLALIERRRLAGAVQRRGWLVRRALLTADLFGLVLAFVLAQQLYPNTDAAADRVDSSLELLIFCLSLPGFVVAAKLYGLYDRDEERTDHSTADDFSRVFHLVTVCTWLLYAVLSVMHWGNPQLPKLLVFWVIAVFAVTLSRVGARAYCMRQVQYLQNTIIVGAGDVGQKVAKKLLNHREYGINLVGLVDAEPKEWTKGLEHLSIIGVPSTLPQLVKLLDVERVIFAFSKDAHDELLDLIRRLRELGVQVDLVPRFFEVLSPGVGIHTVEGVPLMGLPPMRLPNSSRLLKRVLDLVVATLVTAFLAPLLALIALAIKLDSPGPVLFRQLRMGSDEKTFRIFKFRSMVIDAEERKREFAHLNKHLAPGGDPRMFKIEDDPRVTRIGRWLRAYSLDELPQLLNVFAGDMSLVGPRPLILEEDRFVDTWARRRLSLKPGVTGRWQVLGRDGIPFEEMIALDYAYVTNWTLGGDLKLLAKTLPAVARRRSN